MSRYAAPITCSVPCAPERTRTPGRITTTPHARGIPFPRPQEPYYDERLPVREERPELNYNVKKRAVVSDEEWREVMADQPWTASKRRTMLAQYLHAKLEADDGELAQEGCHGFWELAILKDNHQDIRMDRLAALVNKLSSNSIPVATTAAAAVWALATTGGMRRSMADLDVPASLLAVLKKTLKMQTFPDPEPGESLPEGMVAESARARLQLHQLGALAVLLVDRCCRRPYLQQEGDFATLFAMCKQLPGYRPQDEQIRRETSAKVLTSLMQRDGEARLALIRSGSLRQVLTLLNPQGALRVHGPSSGEQGPVLTRSRRTCRARWMSSLWCWGGVCVQVPARP